MENAINISLSPVQLWVSFALQIWIVVIFPIIVIKKLNYLSELLQDRSSTDQQES